MNTIRRPRRRPRVDSLNFRTCWWLIAYEAAYQVLRHSWSLHNTSALTRSDFVALWPKSWRATTSKLLRRHAGFRILP